MLIERYVLDTA